MAKKISVVAVASQLVGSLTGTSGFEKMDQPSEQRVVERKPERKVVGAKLGVTNPAVLRQVELITDDACRKVVDFIESKVKVSVKADTQKLMKGFTQITMEYLLKVASLKNGLTPQVLENLDQILKGCLQFVLTQHPELRKKLALQSNPAFFEALNQMKFATMKPKGVSSSALTCSGAALSEAASKPAQMKSSSVAASNTNVLTAC